MATWKDDAVASEALNGIIKSKRSGSRRLLLIVMASVAVSLLVGVFFLRKSTEVSQVSVTLNPKTDVSITGAGTPNLVAKVAENLSPATATTVKEVADIASVPSKAKAPQLETVTPNTSSTMVRLSEKNTPKAPLHSMRPPDAVLLNLREYLRSGNIEGAKYQLSLKHLPREAVEEQEVGVLHARAELASGNINEARKIFETLAFIPSTTAVGVDALMGNFWCQAGTLTRCRDSELDQVVNGPDSWGKAIALMEQARRLDEKSGGNLEKQEDVRVLYQRALETESLEELTEKECVTKLTELTNRIVLDNKFACLNPKAVFHKVETGDVLERISKRYKVNQGQVKIINRLGEKLSVRLGQILKMLPGEVVYKVDRTHLHGTLYIDNVFIRRYPVGIGPGNATPVGTYTVSTKVANPDWFYDGKKIPFGNPENILGTRWMGFAAPDGTGQGAGLGVHGTAFPESVPGRKSKGCVRMLNKDVEELFDLMPQGGKVEVKD